LEKYKLFFISLLFVNQLIIGQTNMHISARSISLASSVATMHDLSVLASNPVVLAYQKHRSITLQNATMIAIREIQKNAAMFAMPIRKGVVGISVQNFGNKVYRVFSGGLSYAMNLSENLKVGAYLGTKNNTIEQYGSWNSFDVNLAIQGKLTKSITYGMCIQSLHGKSISLQAIHPTVLYVGVKYASIIPKWNLYTELEKSLLIPTRLKIACEYFISPTFILRSGWMSSSYQISAGIGAWFKKKCRIDLGSSWQPVLGVTMQVGVFFSTKSIETSED
jgi:hypothetical protein